MKTNTKLFFWATTILLVANITVLNVSAVAAEFDQIILDPTVPHPKDTVMFSTKIKGENITDVFLIVQECNANTGVCYPRMNVSMTLDQSGEYETEVTLTHDDATYITYNVEVKDDTGWTASDSDKLNLDLTSPPNDNGSTNGNGNDTPGFEAITFLIGVCVTLILVLHSRKRSR